MQEELPQKFFLTLDKEWINNTNLLPNTNIKVVVKTEPKKIYNKWWHKLLNKITLGYKFNEGFKYKVDYIYDETYKTAK